ncbi:MAG: hypothetical protein COA67_03170 [Lutibacter sp.]|nr:MAG: hypothetical protein COA67_03170 [Lutibacter sp.]
MTYHTPTSTKILFLFLSLFFFKIYSQSETVLIDFGVTESTIPWNNLNNNTSGTISNLINSNSINTGISIQITDGFTGINSSGTQTPDSGLNIPITASQDSFYGTSVDSGIIVFSNLITNKGYNFSIFASRVGVSDNRETQYLIEGIANEIINLNAASNTNNSVESSLIYPKSDGTITITISTGVNNTNSNGFYYLNSLKLTYDTDIILNTDNALLIDFGSSTNQSVSPWNNLTNATNGNVVDLVNHSGANSGISLNVIDPFNFVNENGTNYPGLSINIPGTASMDSFFGNTVEFNGKTEPTGAIQFSNFIPNEDVTITIYASRLDFTTDDNKETQYVIEGLTTETLFLDAANNTNQLVTASLKAKADGTLTIIASPGSNNTNANGFFYIGALKVEYDPQPSLLLSYPNGDEFWQVGKSPYITWEGSSLTSNIDLEYSTNNGTSWTNIATVSNLTNSYQWTIPNDVSSQCLVRATSGTVNDISDTVFEISSDSSTCNIVILGSSTAEGTGASSIENSWAYKYSYTLFQKNTKLNVINLAAGGYTTYKILPTSSSTTIPSGQAIDIERNITKALSFNPVSIIVNMPSNDTANGYSEAVQLANFAELNTEALNNSTPIWITTTQPRNFSDPADIQKQINVKDGIISTYNNNAIDFWANIADTNGTILSSVSFGDGVHLNNLGHDILYNKVLNKNIDDLVCLGNVLSNTVFEEYPIIKYYPNPIEDSFFVDFNSSESGALTVNLYNSLGQKINNNNYRFITGNNKIKIKINPNLKSQILHCNLSFETSSNVITKSFNLIIK